MAADLSVPPWLHHHVAHSRIDHAVEDSIIPQLPPAAHQLGFDTYHQHVESYVAFLADTLYRATVALDYPEDESHASHIAANNR